MVDNEEQLRRYTKETMPFLLDLKEGIIPKELLPKCNEDVNIVLEHHLDETFVYAPKPFSAPKTLEQMAAPPSPAKYFLWYTKKQKSA